MTEEKIKEFKKELSELLKRYDVGIGFTCGTGSDTYGLYDDRIVIQENGTEKNIIEADGWWLSESDIE